MKIALIGCSADSFFLVKRLAQESKRLKIERISIYDQDSSVREVFCAFCASLSKSLEPQLRCTYEANVVEALIGADYIVTDYNGIVDQRAVKTAQAVCDHGLLSHPLSGACAFGAALRHVPVLLRLCAQARRYAKPQAQLLNLTAPGGVLLQAAWESGFDFVCGFPLEGIKTAAKLVRLMKREADGIDYSVFGLAECAVLTDVLVERKPIIAELLREDALYHETVFSGFSKTMLNALNCLPAPIFEALFYPDRVMRRQALRQTTREKETYDAGIRCLSAIAPLDLEKQRHTVLEALNSMLQAGAEDASDATQYLTFHPYNLQATVPAATVLDYLSAKQSAEGKRIHMLQKNGTFYPSLSADDCVAVSAFVSAEAIRLSPEKEAAADIEERVRREAYYERAIAKAIVQKDAAAMTQALAMHPLVNSCSVAATMTAELQTINA